MDLVHVVYGLLALFGFIHMMKLIVEATLALMGYEVTATKWWQKVNAKKKEKK